MDDDANVASENHKDKKEKKADPFWLVATVDKVKLVAAKDDSQEVWLKLREGKTVSIAVCTADETMSKVLDSEGARLKFQVSESGKKYSGEDVELKGSPIYTLHNVFEVPAEDILHDLTKSVADTVAKKAMKQ